MRLICGCLRLDGAPASEDMVGRMVAQMAVGRLLPGLATKVDGPVGLAVLDFCIEGRQSLPERPGTIMAADVRLDEPAALAAALGRQPSESEDALLDTALQSFGPDGLDRVLGDFAFASWDGPRQTLTCGRDVFGVRPFVYVYRPGELFAFASLPGALHGGGFVARKIDQMAVMRRLAYVARAEDDLVAGLTRLPAAHYLQVSRSGLILRRYFQFDRRALATRQCTAEEAADELRRLVDQAVACRLPKAGAVGSHLSGGLDSSSVAVLATRKLRAEGRRLHAFSVLDRLRNDVKVEDEAEFVRAVLDQEPDIDWTPVRPQPLSMTTDRCFELDRLVPYSEDAPQMAIGALAEGKRLHIMLSGWGGDEAASYNGTGLLYDLFRRGLWKTLAREIKALERERGWPRWQTVRGQLLWQLAPRAFNQAVKRLLGRDSLVEQIHSMLTDQVRSQVGRPPDKVFSHRIDEDRILRISSPHIARIAEEYALIGARNGLAFAFPLLDRRVVEFALSLPHYLFLRDGVGRRVFRDSMHGVLPTPVRLRHRKLAPMPSRRIDFAESKDKLLDKVEAVAKSASVCRLIDTARLRQEIARFPSPQSCREQLLEDRPSADLRRMNAAISVLVAAEYIAQNGED